MIKAKFKFHPVGQGAFYTGKIVLTSKEPVVDKEFNIVYDCGSLISKKYLNQSTGKYKKELNCNNVNVLILSHLDGDHVNGVQELLKNVTCENIYMPYLTPFNRLMLAVLHESEDDSDTSYYDFIKDPYNYLLEISKADITYILSNTEEGFIVQDNVSISERNELNTEFTFIDDLEDNEGIERIALLEGALSSQIKFKKGNKSIRLGNLWNFYLYHSLHDGATESDRLKLSDELIQEINKKYSIKVNELLTQVQLCDIIKDNDKFKKLKIDFFAKNYHLPNTREKKKGEFINESSLMVLHRPLNYRLGTLKKRESLPPFYSYPKKKVSLTIKSKSDITFENYGLTLLTGDIGMTQIDSSPYIIQNLQKVDIIQVPHHGSTTGWEKAKLSLLKQGKSTSAIINFGYGNTYGHPNGGVLQDLIDENLDIRFATQFEEFEYEFELEYH